MDNNKNIAKLLRDHSTEVKPSLSALMINAAKVLEQSTTTKSSLHIKPETCSLCGCDHWNGYISWYEMLDCQTVIHDEKALFCPFCGKNVNE